MEALGRILEGVELVGRHRLAYRSGELKTVPFCKKKPPAPPPPSWVTFHDTKEPGTVLNVDGPYHHPWGNPPAAQHEDGTDAGMWLMYAQFSDYLYARNWGFTYPGGTEVFGVAFAIKRMDRGPGPIMDHSVWMTRVNFPVGGNHASAVPWSQSQYDTIVYGGPSETWGLTWDASELNRADWGVQLMAVQSPAFSVCFPAVDVMRVDVWGRYPA